MLNRSTQQVLIVTADGEIMVEIFSDRAPITAQNFLRYVDGGLYAGGAFYRAIRPDNDSNSAAISAIQGGVDPGFKRVLLPPIPHETTASTGIRHTDGVLSMARSAPGTAASEFFIVVGDAPALDFGHSRYPDRQGFAAFGRVISGMGLVRATCAAPTNREADIDYMVGQALDTPMEIVRMARLR